MCAPQTSSVCILSSSDPLLLTNLHFGPTKALPVTTMQLRSAGLGHPATELRAAWGRRAAARTGSGRQDCKQRVMINAYVASGWEVFRGVFHRLVMGLVSLSIFINDEVGGENTNSVLIKGRRMLNWEVLQTPQRTKKQHKMARWRQSQQKRRARGSSG